MLSERQLRALLMLFDERARGITDKYLAAVGEHVRSIGSLTPLDVNRTAEMRRSGMNVQSVQRELARSAELSVSELETVFRAVGVSDRRLAEQRLAGGSSSAAGEAVKLTEPVERIIRSRLRVTAQAFRELSQTTIQSGAYRNAVDAAIQAVQSGVTDYSSAIRNALREAGREGLKVRYPSGVVRRLDSAVRQNVLDGVRSLNNEILRQLGEEYGADGVELSAHALCAEDHLPYQGRQFSDEEFEQLQGSLARPFGMWNCRHTMFPIILGVSQPVHTPEELAAYARNSRESIEIGGREKTRYEWTQEQRRIETAVRQQRDIANLAKASGDDVLRREAQANITALQDRYAYISRGAGLDGQQEHLAVDGLKAVKTETKIRFPAQSDHGEMEITLKNSTQNGILVVTNTSHDRKPPSVSGNEKNAVIDVVGKKGGVSRYICDKYGSVIIRVDNNDHGFPKEHSFKYNNAHCHISLFEDGKWHAYSRQEELPDVLQRLCSDIVK